MILWESLSPFAGTIHLCKARLDIFYLDSGPSEKPVCLLLHGLADESETWRHIFTPLSRNYRVIVPDLPGFGRSGKPSGKYTMDFLKDSLLEFLEAMEIEEAHFIGSSLGAMLIQYTGLFYKGKMISQVLTDGVIIPQKQKFSIFNFLFMTPLIGEYLYSRLKNKPVEAYNTLKPYYADLDALPEEDRDFLYRRVCERVSDNRQRHAYFSILRRFSRWLGKSDRFRDALSKKDIPVLMIWGGEDRIISVEAAEKMRSRIPGSEIQVIPRAGHLPHQEKPGEYMEILTAWLNRYN